MRGVKLDFNIKRTVRFDLVNVFISNLKGTLVVSCFNLKLMQTFLSGTVRLQIVGGRVDQILRLEYSLFKVFQS